MVTLDGRDLNKALRRGVNGQMTSKQPENILTVGGKDHCIGEKENMLHVKNKCLRIAFIQTKMLPYSI